jgi:hypothetical protein
MIKILFFFCALIFGCATTQDTDRQLYLKEEKHGFPIHGYFCGKNIPNIPDGDVETKIKYLELIEPIDIIDESCKRHDICFLIKGDGDYECNINLFSDMNKIKNLNEECGILDFQIAQYAFLHAGGATRASIQKIIEKPSAMIPELLTLPLAAFIDVMGLSFWGSVYIFTSPMSISSGLFPDRFEVCYDKLDNNKK